MSNTKVTAKVIADSTITATQIANDAVTGAKIADDVALAGNPTTTTQTAGNNTTRIATTAFVSTAITNLIDSSPDALNTLNELAAALGDDANFSTTVTNSIATKLPLAGGTLTGDLTLTSATSNKPVLTIKNTNADATSPQLVFRKDSTSPSDNDEVGRIYMYGDDDAGNATEAFLAIGKMTDVSNGAEDSSLDLYTYAGGAQKSTLTLKEGAVAIGHTNPGFLLDLSGTTSAKINLQGGTNQNGIRFNAAGDGGVTSSSYYLGAGSDLMSGSDKGLVLLDIDNNEAILYDDQANNKFYIANNKLMVNSEGQIGLSIADPLTRLGMVGHADGGILIKQAAQISYTPADLANFRQGISFVNTGSSHAYSIGYGQGGKLKFSYYDNSSTFTELASMGGTSGDLSILGNLTLASGKGINFQATSDASGRTSELFEDYEEGTWTPVLEGSTGNPTVAYQYRSAFYIKIGHLLFVRFGFRLSSRSGGTGVAQVGGLPYTAKNYGSYQQPAIFTNTQGLTVDPDGPILMYFMDNNNKIQGRLMNNADTVLPISYFQAGSWCIGSGVYDVA